MINSLKQEFNFLICTNFSNENTPPFHEQSILPAWSSLKTYSEPAALLDSKWPLTNPPMSHILQEKDSDTFEKALASSITFWLQGEVLNAQKPLDNFYDIYSLIDIMVLWGGVVAIVDISTAMMYSPDDWLNQITGSLQRDIFDVRNHIQQVGVMQDNDEVWLHTKGMIKFGRPELSIHNIEEEHLQMTSDFINNVAQQIIVENIIPIPNEEIFLNNMLIGYKAVYGGSYEDDDFWRNIHIELI